MEESNPSVLIKDVGGQVKPHSLSDLIKNKAYLYLLQNPGKIGTACKKNKSCPGRYFCPFVHFANDPDDDDKEEEKFFKILTNDDATEVKLISSKRLVRNQAFKFLWKNPEKQSLECRGHPAGITDETCKYVHFLARTAFAEEAASTKSSTTSAVKKNQNDEDNDESDNQENKATIASPQQQQPCPPPSTSCNVCFDELNEENDGDDKGKSTISYLECSKGHRTCRECLQHYFKETYPKKSIDPGTIPQLFCFTKHCSTTTTSNSSTLAPFKAGQIARVVDPDSFDLYLDVFKRAVEAKALSEVSTKLHDIVQMNPTQALAAAKNLEHLTIAKSLADTGNVYMCAKCKYGPILLSGCSALMTHHGQVSSRQLPGGRNQTAAADNSCPSCGHLPKTTNEMLQWDGIVRL